MATLPAPLSTLADMINEANAVTGSISAKAERSSPRAQEIGMVRAGVGGKSRAKLIDDLSNSCKALALHTICMVEAVRDQFTIAMGRDNAFNLPALTIVVRAMVETAATSAWLLEPALTPEDRGRRYLIWRFSELRSDHRLLRDDLLVSGNDPERSSVLQAAVSDLESREAGFADAATAAKWTPQRRVHGANGNATPAALLKPNGKTEEMPKATALVTRFGPGTGLYSLLSRPAHGSLSNIEAGLRVSRLPKRNQPGWLEYHPQGIDPDFALQLAGMAVLKSVVDLATWNAVRADRLKAVLGQVIAYDGAASDATDTLRLVT